MEKELKINRREYRGWKCLRCGGSSKIGAVNRVSKEVLCEECVDKTVTEKVDIVARINEIEELFEQRYGEEIRGENLVLLNELKLLKRIMTLI